MTQPSPSPFPELPISPAELNAARQGVALRGGRIMGALGVLAALSALAGVAGAWALWRAFQLLPGWLAALGEWSEGDLPAVDFTGAVPAWTLPALLTLTLLGTALYVWAILVARQTVGAVRDQTLTPNATHAEAQERSVNTVRPWIVLGQIAPIVQALLPLLVVPLAFGIVQQLDPQDLQGLGFGSLEVAGILLGLVVQSLPTIIITWLILAAIRRWLDAVVARAHAPISVRPVARRVDPWLLFTLILLALGLSGLILGGLPFLVVSAFAGSVPLDDPDLISLGLTPTVLRLGLLVGAALMLGSGLIYLLLTLLMAWSRGFATQVAVVLDAELPGRSVAPAYDPWSGPVQAAQGREPY
ncbi:hypothetical protein [Deinococcus arenicola]|uniref:Glycerophosphoryl diester phosphodiesterase membrane domain-containing protein n=1 Tax=Deinococcus arenicola TaxID=2994950 RepID=A0ABU4DMV5_9DEIO|nr:hypothetical protein [Deinococcus sp. ZS9-10]MDV6373772.1 hypothetical protein [Deinococcus sp. ZS9-10]